MGKRLHGGLSVFMALLVIFASPSVWSDDIEIYVGTDAAVVRPNILFIMDTSGSMRAEVSGTGKSRLKIMQEALNEILDSVSNVNVGLMRFTAGDNVNAGGPILYPVRYVDEAATTPKVESQIEASSDDAVENLATGAVNTTQPAIDMVEGAATTTQTAILPTATGNYQENGTVSVVGSCCSYMGFGSERLFLRFENLNIPQGATILSASMAMETNGGSSSTAVTDIYVVDRDNMPLLNGSEGYPLRGDVGTNNPITWAIPPGSANDVYYTPDLSGLIQRVVNRSGWASGNAIGLYFHPLGGNRDGCTHNFVNCSQLPKLTIQWTMGGAGSSGKQMVGLRFTNVYVPQGATITKAYIEFVAASDNNGASNVTIYAHQSDASPTFSPSTGNLTTRSKTVAAVNWTPDAWTSGSTYRTPDLSNVVQEVVNLPGWCGGPMTFLIEGSGLRRFLSYDGSSIDVPRLVVEFDDASAVGGCVQGTVVKRIASNNDDAVEKASGSVSLGGVELNFKKNEYVGLRFEDVQVPRGASILSAEIEMVARGNRPENLSATIWGINEANPSTFTGSSKNISSRSRTSATVNWSRGGFYGEEVVKTPDISSIVSELVNQSSWNAGNAMAFAIKALSKGKSGVYSVNESPSKAPLLRITYKGAYQSGAITVRQLLKQTVDAFTAGGYTPISGSLGEAARYYRGEAVHYGRVRGNPQHYLFRTSHPESYTGGTDVLPPGCPDWASSDTDCRYEYVDGDPVYISPIDDVCATNHIVLLSDGQPNAHTSDTAAFIKTIIKKSCASGDGGRDCTRKLAEFLATTDQASWESSAQYVVTHTISFAENISFLKEIADKSGGLYRAAYNKEDLLDAFRTIVSNIQDGSRTFVSAGVSVNQFNRLTHRDELYFSLFQPDTDATWPGNLKRYRIHNGVILDSLGIPAVDSVTGGFVSTAKSYWSSVVDGDKVQFGGAAENLSTSRKVYSNVDSAAPFDLTKSGNRVTESNSNITQSMVSASNNSEREAILRWARGIDESGSARKQYGDPLHSRPFVVTYNDGTPAGKTLVFVGDNHGYLHAVNAEDGTEAWAFIPKALLANLKTFMNDGTPTNHIYGLDGRITAYIKDDNNNSMVDPGEKAILYVGMRRGGRNYYAFDISDPNQPKLQFVIEGGVGDYAELGQTWSSMIPARIKWNGADRDVVIFGGGYDPNQDVAGPSATDSMGRTIYIADALTGQMLWNARIHAQDPAMGVSATANMKYSIPADVRAIDITGQGYVEHIYVGDMGGQIFRFDVNQANSGASDFAVGGRIALLRDGSGTSGNRRFYNSPDVAVIKRPQYKDFVSISIGSGYRAHPLDTVINEKFYVIRDIWVLDGKTFPFFSGKDLRDSDLVNVTAIVGDSDGDGTSDALDLIENTTAKKYGWYIQFNESGEKVLSQSVTYNNTVIFTTYIPAASSSSIACAPAEGSGRAYALSILDGEPKIDLNQNGELDDTKPLPAVNNCSEGDYCRDLGRGIPPSPLVIFEPTEASVCFGTMCFDDMLLTTGERLRSIKWRRRTD